MVAVNGNYDDVNRLCAEIAGKYNWGFVNINLRAYYAEGSKTLGFETAEQLGWRAPDHLVAPAASGSLITKIWKSFKEFDMLGFLEAPLKTKIYCAQPEGCSPISTAIQENAEVIKPVKPKTIHFFFSCIIMIHMHPMTLPSPLRVRNSLPTLLKLLIPIFVSDR